MTEQEKALDTIRHELSLMRSEGCINKRSYDYIKLLVDGFEQPLRIEPLMPWHLSVYFEELRVKWERASTMWDFLSLEGLINSSLYDTLQQNWRLLHPARITQAGVVWIADDIIQLPENPRIHEVIYDLHPEWDSVKLHSTEFKHTNFLVFKAEADPKEIRLWQTVFNDKYFKSKYAPR